MQDFITFQLATHYLPKIALRLESLTSNIHQASLEEHPVIHHYAINNLLEIIQLINKPELKSRFLKELIRIEHSLNKFSTHISAELLTKLHCQIQCLSQFAGVFGEGLHLDPFLQSIRAPGQESESDSPQLLLWLSLDSHTRQQDLEKWLIRLNTLILTVNLYLTILRENALFETIEPHNGFYQCPLPKNTCQLILLRIDKSLGIVPSMQLGHHGLSVRLCEARTLREIKETQAVIALAICQI